MHGLPHRARPALRALLFGLACLTESGSAGAQSRDYPNHPVRVIVPFAPGGSGDAVARPYAEMMAKALGQPFVVENRAGAAGALGIETVVKAPADGYTVAFASSSPLFVLPRFRTVSYDWERDLIPAARLADSIIPFGVHPSLGVKTMAEFVALAKAQPGKIAFGSAGIGTRTQMFGEVLKYQAGLDLLHVPYKGTGEAIADLLANQIQGLFDIVVYPHVKTGKLTLLAVASEQRNPDFPDTPTMAEAGFPGVEVPGAFGAFVPTGTSPAIVARLNAELVKIARDPEFRRRMLSVSLAVFAENPEETAAHMKRDAAAVARIIAEAKIKLE